MSIKTKDEILSSIRERFAEDNSDEAIAFLEDVSDTLADLENRAKGDGVDWKAKAQEIDSSWREKYKARFFTKSNEDDNDDDNDNENEFIEQKSMKFEDLFKE